MQNSLELLFQFCTENPEFAFNKGASNSTLDSLANSNQWDFPADFRAFLQAANGETEKSEGVCGGYRFLVADEIQEIHADWCCHADSDFVGLTSNTWCFGESPFYDKSWIPVACLVPRELIMLGVTNDQAFVFSWSVELGANDVYARGFTAFLDRIANELLDGDDVKLVDELMPIAG